MDIVTATSYRYCLLRFCFNVYDLTGKGYVGKEEMTTLLQKCLKLQGQEEEGEDGVKVNIDNIALTSDLHEKIRRTSSISH